MSQSKFPLCESVGLSVQFAIEPKMPIASERIWIRASQVESLLSRGVRVFGCGDDWSEKKDHHGLLRVNQDMVLRESTHTALLIDIKPIAKPERRRSLSESEVREAIADYCTTNRVGGYIALEAETRLLERLFDKDAEGGV